MNVTKVFFKSNNSIIGYSDRALTKNCAEIEQGDTLELLQCKIMTDEPTAFRYMEAVELYISSDDAKDVYFFEIKNE